MQKTLEFGIVQGGIVHRYSVHPADIHERKDALRTGRPLTVVGAWKDGTRKGKENVLYVQILRQCDVIFRECGSRRYGKEGNDDHWVCVTNFPLEEIVNDKYENNKKQKQVHGKAKLEKPVNLKHKKHKTNVRL